MAESLGLKQNTHEVKIYVETTKEIFERCMSRAGIYEKELMPVMLAKALDSKYIDNKLDSKYLRNLYNKIHQPFPAYATKGIYHNSIYTLARFAGIDDYKAFNENYGPDGLWVMYTQKPYALFNFLRLGSTGPLSSINQEWEYKTNTILLRANVLKAQLYTMAGDKNPYWIEVTYAIENDQQCCYFAQIQPLSTGSLLTIQSVSSRLFRFFEKLLIETAVSA